MPVSVKYDGQVIELRLVGKVAGSELLSLLREALAIEEREAVTPNRMIDLREADTAEIRFNDVVSIAEVRRKTKLRNHVKSAILAKTNVQYGIARTFQAINDNPQIAVQVFRDEAEARAWLAG